MGNEGKGIGDPTTLILIDEADRLRTDSLEEIRSLFDDGGVGLVLIGMPGIEKRMARYPPALLPHRVRARIPISGCC